MAFLKYSKFCSVKSACCVFFVWPANSRQHFVRNYPVLKVKGKLWGGGGGGGGIQEETSAYKHFMPVVYARNNCTWSLANLKGTNSTLYITTVQISQIWTVNKQADGGIICNCCWCSSLQ